MNITTDISNKTFGDILALLGVTYTSEVLFQDLMLIPFDSFPWAGIE